MTSDRRNEHVDKPSAAAAEATDAWLRTLRPTPPNRATHESVIAALDAARDEPPTRHG
jgi:hypothetical protein